MVIRSGVIIEVSLQEIKRRRGVPVKPQEGVWRKER